MAMVLAELVAALAAGVVDWLGREVGQTDDDGDDTDSSVSAQNSR
jgi:hypothetical protein